MRRPSRRAVSQEPRRATIYALGLGGILIAIVLVVIGQTATNGIPLRSYYTIDAGFDDADNIAPHAQVRMGGRLVGQVLDPRVEDGEARLTLQLKGGIGPLRDDTRIEVRPRSAIGVRYVELLPGESGAPIAEGGFIPAEKTTSTRPLDEILSTLDAETRERSGVLMRELGASVAGRGEGLNEALGGAPTFAEDLASVMEAIGDRDGTAAGFVKGADTAATAVDPVRRELTDAFSPSAGVADAFAEERDALHETLEEAPASLSAVQSGLGATTPLAREVGRFARTSLPMLESLPATLAETKPLLDEAGPVLEATEPVLDAARGAVDPTLDLLRKLRPELEPLETAFEGATPIVNNLGPRYCDLRNMFGNWSSMMQFGTTLGNYLRFNVPPTPESVQGHGGGLDLGPLAGIGNAYPAPCEAGTEQIGGRGR